MTEDVRLSAVILAGGESRRMGASKALVDFRGEPLLTRVVRRCRAFADDVVVVARRDQPLPACDARVVRDPIDGEGPLVGLLGGLEAVADPVRPTFVATTDAPFVDAAVARFLGARLRGADAAVAVVAGKRHVLGAVYGPGARAVAATLVASGKRRASLLAESIDTRWIDEVEIVAELGREALRAFENVNTEEELDRARRSTTL